MTPDFYNPIYYSIVKKPFLRFGFEGIERIQVNYSQLHQDLFVLCVLGGKRGGTYLEIGAHEPVFISNTYLLEHIFNWKGLGLELDGEMVARHLMHRKNPCLHADALTVDYASVLAGASLNGVIDYLSIDIDPPANSLQALKRIPHDCYRFRVITFEHDLSRGGARERAESRRFLEQLGYQLLVADVSWGNCVVEDWWVEPTLVSAHVLHEMRAPQDAPNLHDHYFYSTAPGSQSLLSPRHSGDQATTSGLGGLCIEGWRGLNHSYSLVNQWQLLQLSDLPIRLRHRDLPPYLARWNPVDNNCGMSSDLLNRVLSIPGPGSSDYFDAIYRIAFPISLAPGPAERLFVFGTSERGVEDGMVTGATPGDALSRGNVQIITPSHWSRQGFLRGGFDASMVQVIPHGVDPASFYPVEPELRAFYRDLLGFRQNEIILLNVGALTRNKGVDLLLTAYAELKARWADLRLVVKDQSNLYGIRLEDVLRDMMQRGDHGHRVEGFCEDVISISENLDIDAMRALYNAADLYVSPYRCEGFNLPPLEAAACGCPILVTAGGATDDYFSPELGLQIASRQKSEGCFLTLEPELDSLIDAIDSFLLRPTAWGQKTGSELVHSRFSWNRVCGQLVNVLGFC